jgi:hypothetical protein
MLVPTYTRVDHPLFWRDNKFLLIGFGTDIFKFGLLKGHGRTSGLSKNEHAVK